ncbi:DNA-binding NarL/FixJ family response regulator [Paenibacillus phyllosphaerae]|uniref:DNA-binding NarL/FixJ family response regulator n=1 Tax=Paenibacillus phyllosphaerae TaxID=274593 RepID=A0A7W5B0P2_9BACL|nr:response regulator transcription factor [Paenibacillus phyllosphaerae]MBB3112237.1 DNA-binding NarL/FixJ family response regulator [Paenibacillus phyllosphaerae]
MIHVLIADDQRLLLDGLQTIIQLEEDMEVVGIPENGLLAYEAVASLKPDIVLMDIKMPVMDGIEAMKLIKRDFPATIVLMLTTFAEDKFIVDAMAGGADGFLLKDMSADKVVRTIREALLGQLMLPAPIAAKLAARLSALSPAGSDAFDERELKRSGLVLTERERKIILLMIEGYTNKQISVTLFMSEGTVRNYISVIYNKIGTNDRKAAIALLKELLLDAAY